MTHHRNVEGKAKRGDSSAESVPLVVDLDGTLLRTDLLLESGLRLIKQRPWLVLLMPFWLLKGRAYLKRKIFQEVQLDVSLLPPREELLTWLRDEKARGRRLILATASDYEQACTVAEPLGLFDTVLGSDGRRNLKGREKLKTIVDVCGKDFDYIGNSSSDLAIWRDCRGRHGSPWPFLFGRFSAADAMYAPVASRFRTYLPDLAVYGDDGTAHSAGSRRCIPALTHGLSFGFLNPVSIPPGRWRRRCTMTRRTAAAAASSCWSGPRRRAR